MNKNIIFMTISLLGFNVRCTDLFKWCRSNEQKNIVKDKEQNYNLQLFNKKKEALKKSSEEIKKHKKWVIFEIIAKGCNMDELENKLTKYFNIDYFTAFEEKKEDKIKDEIEKEMEQYDEKEKGIFKFIKILEKSNCVFLSEEEAKILIKNLYKTIKQIKTPKDQYGAQQSFFVLYKDISSYKCKNLAEIEYFDVGISYSINIVAADTSEVTNMNEMFCWCRGAEKINGLQKINTSKVTDMSHMFWDCKWLEEIKGIENWKVNKVTNMYGMFIKCSSLISLPDISGWNTGNVTDMSLMFYECSNLREIKGLENWNVDNVINMRSMFEGCKVLTSFDLSKWEMNQDCNREDMLKNCGELKKKKLGIKYNDV